jgi:hypothetical protein
MPSPSWSRTRIAGKPVDVYEPEAAAVPFALIWLHDEAGGLPASLLPELAARRLRCVAPQAPRSWWVDRLCPSFDPDLTPERFVTEHVRPWLLAGGRIGPRALALAGIGMGGQGAVRLGLRHPGLFPVVAGLESAFDFHEVYGSAADLDQMYPDREQARLDTAVLHVSGHDWPSSIWFACSPRSRWYRGNDRLHEKLAAVGVPHVADLDSLAPPEERLPQLLDHLLDALGRETRRLA